MRWRWTIVNFTVCQNTISSSCYDYITHDNPNCLCTSAKEFSYKYFTSPFIAWMLESTEFLDLQWAEMLALRALKSEGWNHLKAIWTYHVGHASFFLLLLLLLWRNGHASFWSVLVDLANRSSAWRGSPTFAPHDTLMLRCSSSSNTIAHIL